MNIKYKTIDYGGSGCPDEDSNNFEVNYGNDKKQIFTNYEEAYKFYAKQKTDKTLWDVTSHPDLIECHSVVPVVELEGKIYPVLFRDKKGNIDSCRFCGIEHKHSKGSGHRLPHCLIEHGKKSFKDFRLLSYDDNTTSYWEDGYYVVDKERK